MPSQIHHKSSKLNSKAAVMVFEAMFVQLVVQREFLQLADPEMVAQLILRYEWVTLICDLHQQQSQ